MTEAARLEWYGDKVLANVKVAKKAALTMAGQVIQAAAVPLINRVSGDLAGSINYKVIDKDDECRVGTNVEYAPYVEFGTGKYAEGGDGRKTPWAFVDDQGKLWWTAGGRPFPYLRPALDNNSEQILKVMGEMIGKAAEDGGKK